MARVALNVQTIGFDANEKPCIIAHFICDSQADLPSINAYTDNTLLIGCTAHCITEHTDYELKSGGTWVQTVQPSADYDLLTNRPQINGHILTGDKTGNDLGLQNALTFDSTPTQNSTNPVTSGGIWTDQQRQDALQSEDRSALVDLVDNGAKNLVNAPSGTGTRFVNIPIELQPGNYNILFQNIASTDTDSTTCQIGAFASDDKEASNFRQLQRGETTGGALTVTRQTSYVRLYASRNYADGAGDTVSFTGCMICTEEAWKISQTYQPYRPSWQEMYDMILALQ